MNDFLKLSIIFEKLAQQMALPGIEPGIERSKEQFPFEKNIERNIENKYRQERNKWRREPEKGTQEGLQFDLKNNYSKGPYEHIMMSEPYQSDLTLPGPGSFLPEIDISQIYKIIDTKTTFEKHIENVIKNAKQPLDESTIKLIRDVYETESAKYPTDEDAFELYNDVRFRYNEFYKYFLIIQKEYNEHKDIVKNKISGESINEILNDAIDVSLKLLKKNIVLRFFEDFRNEEVFKYNKKEATKIRAFIDFQTSLNEKTILFKTFDEIQTNGATKLKEKLNEYLLDPNNIDKLKAIKNNDKLKLNIFDGLISYIRNSGYRFFDVEKINKMMDDLITSSIESPIAQTYRYESRIYLDEVASKVKERMKNLLKDFLTETKNAPPEKIEKELSKFFDLNKFKRMAGFSLFGDKNRVNDVISILPNYINELNYEDFTSMFWRHGSSLKDDVYAKGYSSEQLNEVIDKEAYNSLKQIFAELLEQKFAKHGINIPLTKLMEDVGDFGIKDIIDHYGNEIGNKDFIGKFIGAVLKRPEATDRRTPYYYLYGSFLTHYKFEEKMNFLLDLSEKFKIQDMNKLIDVFLDDVISTNVERIYNELESVYDNDSETSKDLLSKSEIKEIIFDSIKSIGTIKKDINNVVQIAREVHNYGTDIDPVTLKKLVTNPNISQTNLDIVKKFNSLIIKIAANGGPEEFLNKFKDEIEKTQNRNLVTRDFQERLKNIFRFFDSSIKINPSSPEFTKIKNLINKTNSDIETITSLKEFEKYYDKADKVKKIPELFRLNMDVSQNVRFRVLPDLDPQYFTVGNETDCCQSPGGAGEEAMVDSFINPNAGVVVLEHNVDGDWKTVAQSYFHYVPEDNGYILDNVETAPKIENISNIPIEDFYAYWAQEKMKELNLKYFQSGRSYSDIDREKFNTIESEKDPRSFAVDYPYTDWHTNSYNIDLSKPNFEYNEAVKTAMFRNIFKMALMFDRLIRKG